MSRFSLFGSKFKTSAFSGKKISSFSPSSKPRKAFKETGFHRSLRLESLEDRSLLSISLGGHVWLDANADGLHGTAESAFQGASVELYSSTNATVGDSDDVLVARATTDATGSYNFTDQTAGNYFTTVRIPAGYAFTTQNAGTDDALDSDVNAFGVSNLITLADGESLTTLDAGLTGSAPAFGSAASIDASYSDSANAVAIDPNGNIYITGNYEGVIDFDPGIGVYNLTSTGDSSAFIAKYSSAGALVWVKNFGTTGNNSGFSIVYSSEGGIIVTGSFDGTADFNPGGTASTLTSAGGPDIFVCYYDAQGTFRWVKGFGGTGYDVGHNLTQADDGTICVTGYFSNTVDFDTTESTCIFTSNGSTDAFILKMDFDGSFIWAKQIGGTETDTGSSVDVDAYGNIYTIGSFIGSVDFNPGTEVYDLTSPSTSHVATFISKLDADGNFLWAKQLGGSSWVDAGQIVAMDDSHIYATGFFKDTADFDPGSSVYNLTTNGSTDIYILQLDTNGNFGWARRLGGESTNFSTDIAVDTKGFIYLTGCVVGPTTFGSNSTTVDLSGSTSNQEDAFLLKLDTSGNYIYSLRIGGADYDHGSGIVVDNSGTIYLVGGFAGTVDFDPYPGVYNLTSSAVWGSAFLAKYVINAPSNIALTLTDTAFSSDNSAGTAIGTLACTDADTEDSWTYALVSGNGSDDNACFTVDGNQLKLAQTLDFTAKAFYSIRLRVTDYFGQSFEKTFTLSPRFSIFGTVWYDAKSNGIQDATESGFQGASVEIYSSTDTSIGNADDVLVAQITTDATGAYSYSAASNTLHYYIKTRIPGGYYFSSSNVGSDDLIDSDVTTLGVSSILSYSPTQAVADIDVGVRGTKNAFGWASSIGSTSNEYDYDVAFDNEGNVYSVGSFAGTVDFDPGPGTYSLTSAGYGNSDIFIAKYTNDGSLLWAKCIGGSYADAATALALANGSVYVTGYFMSTVDFNPGSGVTNLQTSSTTLTNAFILKLDDSGNFAWAKSLGSTNRSSGCDIAVSEEGYVYTTGSFSGTAYYNPSAEPHSLVAAGDSDAFILKLDADGNFVWTKSFGNVSTDVAKSIALDASGNVYTTGTFSGIVDFDPGSGVYNLTVNGSYGYYSDVFISKLDADGNFVWAKSFGGSYNDVAYAIAVANDGSVYTAGSFLYSVDFNPGSGVYTLSTYSSSVPNAFVSKLDANGDFVWAKSFGYSSSSSSSSVAYGLALDVNGNVYATGSFIYKIDFDPGDATAYLTNSSTSSSDLFVVRLDSAGNYGGAFRIGGSDNDQGNAVALDENGAIYLAGQYYSTIDFDPFTSGLYSLTSNGLFDAFVAKYVFSFCSTLSNDTVAEHVAVGTVVGQLSTTGSYTGDSYTYALISGEGSTDNAYFAISRKNVTVNGNLDFEKKSAYSIRVRTTSSSGWITEQIFTIHVTDGFDPSISGRVWKDANANGLQDASESGFAYAFVELYSSTGTLIAQRQANASGQYSFQNLGVGSYYATVRIPQGYTFAKQNAGTDDALDSDVYSTGKSATFALSANQSITNLDAGITGSALSFGWAGSAYSWIDQWSHNPTITVDSTGNVYVGGVLSTSCDFDLGPGTCAFTGSSSGFGTFMVKYSPEGTILWSYNNTDSLIIKTITIDQYDNVYATGWFKGTVDFDFGLGTHTLTETAGQSFFILKMDSNGNYIWAKQITSNSTPNAIRDIAVAQDGSVYLAGTFQGTLDFDPGDNIYNLSSISGSDITYFIEKLDVNGIFAWAKNIQGNSIYSYNAYYGSIACDADSNVYFIGQFNNSCPIAGLTSAGGTDGFIQKYDALGNILWQKQIGGTGTDAISDIDITADGIFLTGSFAGTADFDPGPDTFNLSSTGIADSYIVKLDAAGNFVWAKNFDGSGSCLGKAIDVARDGTVYTTGYFTGAIDFAPGEGVYTLDGGSSQKTFVSLLDQNGNFLQTFQIGDGGSCRGDAIVAGIDGRIFVAGMIISSRIDADPGPNTFVIGYSSTYSTFFASYVHNAPVTDLALVLTATSYREDTAVGTVLGALSCTDADASDTWTYSLVSGDGSTDNAYFTIEGNKLKTAKILDYETKPVYSLRVRVVDSFGHYVDKVYSINVIDLAEAFNVAVGDWTDAGITLKKTADGKIHFYVTGTTSDALPAPYLSMVTSITVTGRDDADDKLTIDLSGGTPMVSGGLAFNAGTGSGDALHLVGSAGSDAVTLAATRLFVSGRPTTKFTGVECFGFSLGAGDNSVLITNTSIKLDGDAALDTNAAITLYNSTIDMNGASLTVGDLSIVGGTVTNGSLTSGAISIEEGATLQVNQAETGAITVADGCGIVFGTPYTPSSDAAHNKSASNSSSTSTTPITDSSNTSTTTGSSSDSAASGSTTSAQSSTSSSSSSATSEESDSTTAADNATTDEILVVEETLSITEELVASSMVIVTAPEETATEETASAEAVAATPTNILPSISFSSFTVQSPIAAPTVTSKVANSARDTLFENGLFSWPKNEYNSTLLSVFSRQNSTQTAELCLPKLSTSLMSNNSPASAPKCLALETQDGLDDLIARCRHAKVTPKTTATRSAFDLALAALD